MIKITKYNNMNILLIIFTLIRRIRFLSKYLRREVLHRSILLGEYVVMGESGPQKVY